MCDVTYITCDDDNNLQKMRALFANDGGDNDDEGDDEGDGDGDGGGNGTDNDNGDGDGGGDLFCVLAGGGKNLQLAIIHQCNQMIRHRKERHILARTSTTPPKNITCVGVQAEQLSAVVMGESIKQSVIHDCRAHVECNFGLLPPYFYPPTVVFAYWFKTVYPPVFGAKQNPALMNCWSGHVLVMALVRKGLRPQ